MNISPTKAKLSAWLNDAGRAQLEREELGDVLASIFDATGGPLSEQELEAAKLRLPAGVIARTWRNGSRQAIVAWLLGAIDVAVETLTDEAARLVCGSAGIRDVVDASVVIAARRHNATVISSDRADLAIVDR